MICRKAFTLIELLVVIAIIAILAAILFPVFAQAKAAAKTSVTLSNTKQISLSMIMYSTDFDDMRVPRRIQPTGNEISWRLLTAPYTKNRDVFKDLINPAAGYPDLESDPAARTFYGWPPLQPNEKFVRGYVWANIWAAGDFQNERAVSMTSFDNPSNLFNLVEAKTAWVDMGPYIAWSQDVDGTTYGVTTPTNLQWTWGGDKTGNKAMICAYMDGHSKRIPFSAACGASFMHKPVGSTDTDYWGLSAAQQTGYSWADTWCTTLPTQFR